MMKDNLKSIDKRNNRVAGRALKKSPTGECSMLSGGLHVRHDHPLAEEYNRVMPLFEDESLFLARLASHRGRVEHILDLCSGSGVLGISATPCSSEVTGVDINSKAVSYACDTAILNGVQGKCNFLLGDLYQPVKGLKFDLIICNPPFVPLPFDYRMFLSADGGPDGMDVVRRVIGEAADHLVNRGRMLLITMSLGNESEPLVYSYLRKAFKPMRSSIVSTHIYESVNISAEPFFNLFRSVPTYSDWRTFLADKNLTHLYYMLHEISPSTSFSHEEQLNTIPFQQTELSGSWAGRLNRFRTWFMRKQTSDNELNKIVSQNSDVIISDYSIA